VKVSMTSPKQLPFASNRDAKGRKEKEVLHVVPLDLTYQILIQTWRQNYHLLVCMYYSIYIHSTIVLLWNC